MGDNNGNFNTRCGKLLDGICYRDTYAPKFNVFSECFPGKIEMSDADGIVEINGNFLCVEFKYSIDNISEYDGQTRMLKRMSTIPGWSVAFIECDARTMACTGVRWVVDGSLEDKHDVDIDDVKAIFAEWSEHARKNPMFWSNGKKFPRR